MAVRIVPLPAHGINFLIWTGKVTDDDLRAIPRWVRDEGHPTDWAWVNWFVSGSDASGLALTSLAELRSRSKEAVDARGRPAAPIRTAIIIESEASGDVLTLWQDFVASDPDYPSRPKLVSTLEEACEWIGADLAARAAMAELMGRAKTRLTRA